MEPSPASLGVLYLMEEGPSQGLSPVYARYATHVAYLGTVYKLILCDANNFVTADISTSVGGV